MEVKRKQSSTRFRIHGQSQWNQYWYLCKFLITDKENRLSDDFMDDDVSSETQLYDALSLSAAISP